MLSVGQCSGDRPVCDRCRKLSLVREYDVDEGDESRRVTLQKRYDRLENEKDQYQELVNLIQSRPDGEVHEIIRQLRTGLQAHHVLQHVKHAHMFLTSPDPTSGLSTHPLVVKLDSQALVSSPIKLRARPWTTVVGDGLISSLISSFFAWDGSYVIPAIDLVCFTRAMHTGDISNDEFCSPTLVNAMCCVQVSLRICISVAYRRDIASTHT